MYGALRSGGSSCWRQQRLDGLLHLNPHKACARKRR